MTTTYDIAALEALRDRVREATGPSRELDCLIHVVAMRHQYRCGDKGNFNIVDPPFYAERRFFFNPVPEVEWIGYDLLNISPRYTSSLDACAALQAEVLPGALMGFWNMEDGPGARIIPSISGHDYVNAPDIAETAATMPLAWLSAILSALIAMHREAVK